MIPSLYKLAKYVTYKFRLTFYLSSNTKLSSKIKSIVTHRDTVKLK